ncbi:palmitoyltransferase ZDHHC4-like isoform X1 [Mya arenaria]|uniref:palmitoyltransferase ZDHHC4-like isoform X1 n=1 Tax=Mya arenaria TaxID=6604 RepID=UPI0022DF0864|nr:palmitoyltransferase ZDHHC4-like isoform X1 [Mya arenaria]
MDFLLMLIIYCILFIVGTLCVLYRDAQLLNSGPIGVLKDFVIETFNRLIPQSLQNGCFNLCEYLLYRRNSFFQLIFAVLLLLAHAVWVVDMLPILYHHYPAHNHTFWPFVAVFVNYYCWHKAWTGDPGTITMKSVNKYMQVYQYDNVLYESGKKCSTCQLPKPARSKHCSICNRCVHRFDHHCIWTNNCVGGLNHRYFILFMATLLAMFMQGIYVGTGCILDFAHETRLFKASFRDDDGQIMPITVSIAFQHLFMALPRLVFLVIAVIVLTILVGIFFCHHLYLIFTNQTTNERHKLQEFKYQMDQSNSTYQSETIDWSRQSKCDKHSGNRSNDKRNVLHSNCRPYSRGILNNFLEVFLPHKFIHSRIKQN